MSNIKHMSWWNLWDNVCEITSVTWCWHNNSSAESYSG